MPDIRRVYVANRSSNQIAGIDTATNTVLTAVTTGTLPVNLAITPDGSRVYVSNSTSNDVAVIDTASNQDFFNKFSALGAAYPDLISKYMAGQLGGKGMFGNGPTKYDADNSILYTTRLRLNMKAKVWDNVNFSGRLNMYKNWGDSTGTQVFDSFDSFTMDGTNSGNTTGDRALSGAAIGGGAGLVGGALLGAPVAGMAVGAAGGAAVGALTTPDQVNMGRPAWR